MFKLRDYQNEAVYSVFRYFDKHKAASGDPVIVLPTGCHEAGTLIRMFDGSLKKS